MSETRLFMKFQNRGVVGLKEKLGDLGWWHHKIEDGQTIMYRYIRSMKAGKPTKSKRRHEKEFTHWVNVYEQKKADKIEQEREYRRQNKLDKEKFIRNRTPYVDKTLKRDVLAENKRRAAAMGLTFAKYDRKKLL